MRHIIKHATFYLMNKDDEENHSSVEQLVCEITAKCWRNGKRILIVCEDRWQAIRLDEALWICPEKSFIPHNLSGEGLKYGSPVEISWSQNLRNSGQDVLINLRVAFIDFAFDFTEVVDFVPYEEPLKQLARERYKAYRLANFTLNVKNLEI